MKDVGKIYIHSVYFTAISYILWPYVVILVYFSVLVCCTKKNLATLKKSPIKGKIRGLLNAKEMSESPLCLRPPAINNSAEAG
jgi:hypothetical protein